MDRNEIYTDKKQSFFKSTTFGMIVAGLAVFFGILAFLPEAGVVRTIPLMIVCGFVCDRVCTNMPFYCTASAVICFVMYLFRGSSVGSALLFTAVVLVLCLCGVYVSRLTRLLKKTEKKSTKKKCLVYSIASVMAACVVSVVFCGNIVSFLVNDSFNTAYIDEYYGEKVDKLYTSYSFNDATYKTYISFDDGNSVLGNENDKYISRKRGVLSDGCRDYFEEKLLDTAERRLALVISSATDAFEITSSDVDFGYGEILPAEPDIADYLARTRYVVSLYSIVEEKESFAEICEDCVAKLAEYSYPFEEIVICAGNASEVLFSLDVKEGMTRAEVAENISDFEPGQVEHVGVTEKTILDYWYNR